MFTTRSISRIFSLFLNTVMIVSLLIGSGAFPTVCERVGSTPAQVESKSAQASGKLMQVRVHQSAPPQMVGLAPQADACTDSCAATQADTMSIVCIGTYDPDANCAPDDLECIAVVTDLRVQCIADANTAYDSCTAACAVPPSMIDQTITVTIHAPTSAFVGDVFTVEATASSELPVSYSASGACTNAGAEFTMTSGSGDCTVLYDQAGDTNYNPAPQVVETVTQTIVNANSAPVIAEGASKDLTMSVNGSPIPFALALNAADVNFGDTLTWDISTPPLHGIATITAGSAAQPPPGCGRDTPCPPPVLRSNTGIGYVPDVDYVGSDSFDVQVSDGTSTDTITVNVTIEGVNHAPVITEDASTVITMSQNGSPTAFDLTLYATDADGDPLTWSIVTPAAHGAATTASGTGDSNVIGYIPATDYVGSDSFDVQVSDEELSDTITVNVSVTANPVSCTDSCAATQADAITACYASLDPASLCAGDVACEADVIALRDQCIVDATVAYSACTVSCTPPPTSCTDSCAATQTDAIASCDANFDPAAVCGGDAACEADVTAMHDSCIADANTAYSACTTSCINPTPVDQTITVTTHAPANVDAGEVFTVEATASSGLPVSYSASGSCMNLGAIFTMYNSWGNCTVMYDQAGNTTYNPAPQVMEVVRVQVPCETCGQILAGNIEACNAGLDPIAICGGDPACEIEIAAARDACIADANEEYADCTLFCVNSTPVDQTITVTTHAPEDAVMGQVFTVEATASSELPVSYSASGDCTNVDGTFTITTGRGTCTIVYDQDGDANYNRAPQVTEVVADANDAPVITEGESINVTMSEDGSPIPFDLILHIIDADSGEKFTWTLPTQPSHGTVMLKKGSAGGHACPKNQTCPASEDALNVPYKPDLDYAGSDSFDLQVSDGELTDTITVNVTIENVNDAPVITESNPQEVTMSQGGSPIAFDLTLHATDIENDPLTWSIVSPASYGTATTTSGAGDSNLIGYAPNVGYSGPDSFGVEVSDGDLTADITVNVIVEPANLVDYCNLQFPSGFTINSGQLSPLIYGRVYEAGITPPDGGSSSVLGEVGFGPVGSDPTGNASWNWFGTTFNTQYGNDDEYQGNFTGPSVSTTTQFAYAYRFTLDNGSSYTYCDNDGSGTNAGLSFSPSHLGVMTVNVSTYTLTVLKAGTGSGTVTSSPAGIFCGSDCSESYIENTHVILTAAPAPGSTFTGWTGGGCSGTGTCSTTMTSATTLTATFTLSNIAPVITEGASVDVGMLEDNPSYGNFNLTLHVTDADSSILTWSVSTPALHGVAVTSGMGLSKGITYSPNTNYNGSDSFVVQVSDGTLSDTITVNVAITPVNDVPTFTKGADQTVNENAGPQAVPGWATNISAGPADESGQVVSLGISGNTNPSLFAVGPSINTTTGTLTYTPALNANGSATISVTASDDGGFANGGEAVGPKVPFVITVNVVNLAPVITEGTSVSVTMSQGGSPQPFNLTLHATDMDTGLTSLAWSIATSPLRGSAGVVTGASGTSSTGTVSYTPNIGYTGTDSFNVRVSDGALTDIIRVDVTIRPVLTVKADAQSKVYGVTDPAFTFKYFSFQGTDGPSNIDIQPTCTVLVPHVNAGAYPIVCSGGSDDKYDFAYVNNMLTVTPKPITVTADAKSKPYGAVDPSLTYQVTSGALASGDAFSGSLTRAVGESLGAYAISQGTLSAGSNYNLTFVGADLTIIKADQTISITIDAPANAVTGSSFTVAAAASSGLPVSYSSSGSCTNTGATFTITNGAGACTVMFDQAGNINYNAAPQVTRVVADGTAPLVNSSVRANANPTSSASVDFTVSFTESVTGVDASDFTLTTTGVSGATVSGVSGSGAVYTVTVNTGTANGTIRLNVADNDSIVDAASNPLGGVGAGNGGFITGETYTINKGSATAPAKPTLVSPNNGALTIDYTPLLDWNDSVMPAGTIFDHYQLQVATDSAFTIMTLDVNINGISNSAFTPLVDLASNTQFYWRVRVSSAYGTSSVWSNVRNFDTALLPPILIAPSDAQQLVDNHPTFDWDDVPDATGYKIQISDDIGFGTNLVNSNVTLSTFIRSADLPAGTTLYWRVQSRGANGPSDWSAVRVLITADPPSEPTPVSPANNAKVSGPSPLFDWSDIILPAGTIFDHYQLQVATDGTFTMIVYDHNISGIGNSQDDTAVLAPATTYSWRVRAMNTAGAFSTWSAVRAVKIKFAGPTLNLPASGSTVSGLRPIFTWATVSGAASYTIQVSTSPTFGSPMAINKTATGPTYTSTTNLLAHTTYYWRVRVKSPTTYGPGDWSQVFTFTTP